MPPQTLEKRVERLEQRVTTLEQLPARVDALALQISQLRDEMHVEFSAVRDEVRAGDERVIATLREEMHTEFSAIRSEIKTGDERVVTTLREDIATVARMLRDELLGAINAAKVEVMGQSRTLYEDMHAKFSIVEEGRQSRGKRRSRE